MAENIQLVAYGAQDIYLTGNPQMSYFKVYKMNNFSMESIQQSFDGNADFGGSVVATISRNGDLVKLQCYLEHSATFYGINWGGGKNIGLCKRYGQY